MIAPVIKPGGAIPNGDGDINLYSPAKIPSESYVFNQNRRVVFVNGMQNTPQDHRESAQALSFTQACPVIGVYNETDGFWTDLGQCISDKVTLVGPQAGNFEGWKKATDDAYLGAKEKSPRLTKQDYVASLVEGNKATHSFYSYVVTLSAAERASLKIYSHSQGNLITSNALTAVALAEGATALNGIEVYSYGSPCRYWPKGIKHQNFAFTFDPVALLDLRAGFSTSKVGFVGVLGIPLNLDPMYAHSFLRYMDNDAEFVVNRFRWGSFGMTVSMDEAGLAKFCVSMGNNPHRLKKIFERLKRAHWTDSDDVALEYVSRMHKTNDHTMRALARSDRSLVQLLIGLMESGYTSAREKTEINYLKELA